MSDISQATTQSVADEARPDLRTLLFGPLAFIGAGASIVFCFAQVLISLIAPLFGMNAFEMASYPTASLVSYQINRQLSGWHLPPLVFRAFGAQCLLWVTSGPSAAPLRTSVVER